MNRTFAMFFATGAVFVLLGMAWGIEMSARQDFTMAPAHAHLNLIGFVLMSVFGAYYALNREAGESRLATIHYWLHVLAVIVMVPGIVQALNQTGETLVKAGSALAFLSMALFVFITVRGVMRARASTPA